MTRALFIALALALSAPAMAQGAVADPRGEVLGAATVGALAGAALPVAAAGAGCGMILYGQGDIGLSICGAFGILSGMFTFGPLSSCGAAIGTWMRASTLKDSQSILFAALPGVGVGLLSTGGLFAVAMFSGNIGAELGIPLVIGTVLLGLAAAPISVCGATLATPSGPVAEVPPPRPSPRRRDRPPPKRRAPPVDPPVDDGEWEPPEPPPPPLLPQMGY